MVAVQLAVKQWYEVPGETIIANATFDRLLNYPEIIELTNESLRKKFEKLLSKEAE